MSEQYPGGFITKSPPTPSGAYENSSGYGIWNLSQQAGYKAQGLWPTAGSQAPDAQFNYVTMLLHGDGTNGAQNNTFLDSSSNAFTITRNGNTSQGSFSPYGSNWSTYLPSGSYQTVGGQDFGTGAFTIEFWVYLPEWVDSDYNAAPFGGEAAGSGIMGGFASTGAIGVGVTATSWNVAAGGISLNTWTHIAIVREGTGTNQTKIYVNGTLGASGTISTNCTDTAFDWNRRQASVVGYSCYFSNIRIVKSAVYTSNFTPSTTPLTAISGTSLLACQANRFVDNSGNNYTINKSGTPSIQRFNPFGTSTAYSTATIGGSGYFDGTTDWLSVPNNTAFDMGSGDFTIEGWFYQTGNGYLQEVIAKYEASYQASFSVELDATTLGAYVFYGSTSYLTVYSGTPPKLNTWNHFALQRNGSYNEFYLNGVRLAQVAAQTMRTTTSAVRIGDLGAGYTGYGFQGHISDIRVRKGTATYSGTTYTVPTAPLTAVSNTVLLCSMQNGAIYDNAMMNDLETVGNAQISTSVVKYGTGSVYFNGGSDSLYKNNAVALGSGDFTVECWVYRTALVTSTYQAILSTRGVGETGGTATVWFGFKGDTPNKDCLAYYGNPTVDASAAVGTNVIPITTWTHVAVVRSGSTIKTYVNGVQAATSTDANSKTQTIMWVGNQGSTYPLTAYIDDMRVSLYARYTTTFTPPTQAFPNTGPV